MKIFVLLAIIILLFSTPLRSQWKAVGPYGGEVNQICPLKNTLFALGYPYEPVNAFISQKGTIEWSKLYKPFSSPKYLSHLYVYKNVLYASLPTGAYRSEDGINWERTFENLPLDGMPKRIRQVFLNDNLILVGTENGILRSTDQGKSWEYPKCDNSNFWGELLNATPSGDTIIAGNYNGIQYTRDKGVTWDTALRNDYPNENTINCILIAGNKFFVCGKLGLYYSNDGLSSWKKLTSSFSYNRIVQVSDSLLIASVDGPGGLRYYKSKGDTYELTISKLGDEEIKDLVYSEGILYVASKHGVYVSDNQGKTWIPQNKGLRRINVWNFSTLRDSLLFGTWDYGSYITGNLGESWSSPDFAKEITRATLFPTPTPEGLRYALSPYLDMIYISTDNWKNYEIKMLPTNFRTITLMQTESAVISGASNGIYISKDTAKTWQLIDSALLPFQINCFARNPKGILAGADLGMLRSTDDGESWSKVPHCFAIPSIDGITTNGSLAVAYNSEGNIYFSWDYGVHWNTIYTPYDDITATLIGRTIVYNAPEKGIYLSRDYGSTWEAADYDFSDENVSSLYVFGDYLFAGSAYGVFVAKLSDLGIEKSLDETPRATGAKVFPNPAADYVEISTPLEAFSADVFDSEGKKALCGITERKFDVRSLIQGTYFLAIRGGSSLEVVPFVVAR